MKLAYVTLTLFILLLAGCKKDLPDLPADQLVIEQGMAVEAVHFFNEAEGLACGGRRGEPGRIWKTRDGGETWETVFFDEVGPWKLYSLAFPSDSNGFAGGEYLYILRSRDRGDSWYWDYLGDNVPTHEKDRVAFKDIHFVNDSTGFFTGGQDYDKGIVYRTKDGGKSYDFQKFEHELNSLYFSDQRTGYLVGYGVVYQTADGGDNYQPKDLGNNFFTGISRDIKTFNIVGNSGSMITSEDGESWKKQKSSASGAAHFTDIELKNGKGIAVGRNGLVLLKEQGTESWEKTASFTTDHLTSIFWSDWGKVYLSSSEGTIYTLSF